MLKALSKFKININVLKTIAIIAMVIDHVAFYFAGKINENVYTILRLIGRIAMPVFTYVLVQGFFHTKNFKKYITRMSIFAVITQMALTIVMIINKMFYPEYIYATKVYVQGNILFTFVICLALMKILHEDIIIKKWDYHKNLSIKIVLIVTLIFMGILIPIDYGKIAPVLCILLYYVEKLKIQIFINKTKQSSSISTIAFNMIGDSKLEVLYLALVFLSLVLVFLTFDLKFTFLFAILPIALYNGEKGECNNFVKYMYYIIFPVQHILLYLLAMLT